MSLDWVEIRRWLEKADRDRRLARAALSQDPPIPDGAGFHCQQAIEKLLKAFLVFHCQQFERIHDLRMLASMCARLDADFTELIAEVAPLTSFAVRFRYPGPADPTMKEVEEALAVVAHVWAFVLAKLPPEALPG
jgi:HEPN domain-containing protein